MGTAGDGQRCNTAAPENCPSKIRRVQSWHCGEMQSRRLFSYPVSVGLLVAIFVSNLPEAIGSSTEMRAAGTYAAAIRRLWLLVALICTAATVAGYAIADNVSGNLNAAVDGFAAGALLVMLIDSMIPEAVRKGGDVSGLATVLGFALAAALSRVS